MKRPSPEEFYQYNSVLKSFIDAELKTVPEHLTRKGIPKGMPIGFNKRKMHAVLLRALTMTHLKSIASFIQTSETVVAQWVSQEDFQAKVQEVHALFREYVKNSYAASKDKKKKPDVNLLTEGIAMYRHDLAMLVHSLRNNYNEWVNKNYPSFLKKINKQSQDETTREIKKDMKSTLHSINKAIVKKDTALIEKHIEELSSLNERFKRAFSF